MPDQDKLISKRTLKQMVSYGIIGCIASGTDFVLFSTLVYAFGMLDMVANILSVCAGITISFFLNRHFTFKLKDRVARRYVTFFCVGMVGLALSELILFGGKSIGLEPFITKLVSIIIVAVVQFLLNKFVSFRPSDAGSGSES